MTLDVLDLGRLAYVPAFEKQRRVHAAVVAGTRPATVLLVEHDPVITVSRRKAAPQHIVAPPALLARLGIDVQPTDRGGDITYHGPGQLVAYPILRLADFGLNVGRYIRLLEAAVIDAAATFGVTAGTDPANTGVWVAERVQGSGFRIQIGGAFDPPTAPPTPAPQPDTMNLNLPAKLAAIGVRVSRGVTLHGLALNVTTDLSHFQTIVPCGLAGRGVTSLRALLGDRTPAMAEVKARLVDKLTARLGAAPGTTA